MILTVDRKHCFFVCKRPYYIVYGCFFSALFASHIEDANFPFAIFTIESDLVKIADTVNEVNSNKTSTM